MEKELNYLYSLKQDYLNHLISLRRRLGRQRTWLFTSAIMLLSLQFLNIQPDEIGLFGVKLQSIDIAKILFLVPLIISYQFALYYATKIEERRINITLKSITSTIEDKVGLSLASLSMHHPWVSSHGTHYNIQHRNRFVSLSIILMNTVLWMPVFLIFVLGSTKGLESVLKTNDTLTLVIYIATLVLCVIVVICSRLSVALAYRIGRIHEKRENSK